MNDERIIRGKPGKVIIFFHGYGDSADGIMWLGEALARDGLAFMAPDGLEPAPGIPGGRMWFPLMDFDPQALVDLKFRRAYSERLLREKESFLPRILAYVESAAKELGLTRNDVILMGFSQGAFVALLAAASLGVRGAASLSGVPVLDDGLRTVPRLLVVHGTADRIVPYFCFDMQREFLDARGVRYESLSVEGMGHEINAEALARLEIWIEDVVSFRPKSI